MSQPITSTPTPNPNLSPAPVSVPVSRRVIELKCEACPGRCDPGCITHLALRSHCRKRHLDALVASGPAPESKRSRLSEPTNSAEVEVVVESDRRPGGYPEFIYGVPGDEEINEYIYDLFWTPEGAFLKSGCVYPENNDPDDLPEGVDPEDVNDFDPSLESFGGSVMPNQTGPLTGSLSKLRKWLRLHFEAIDVDMASTLKVLKEWRKSLDSPCFQRACQAGRERSWAAGDALLTSNQDRRDRHRMMKVVYFDYAKQNLQFHKSNLLMRYRIIQEIFEYLETIVVNMAIISRAIDKASTVVVWSDIEAAYLPGGALEAEREATLAAAIPGQGQVQALVLWIRYELSSFGIFANFLGPVLQDAPSTPKVDSDTA